jgi:hypothetical protein
VTVTLSAGLPWSFGAYVPPEGLRTIEGTRLAWVESHCAQGRALLLSQFQGKPRLEALLCALLAGIQDFHTAAWQVLTLRDIANATGVQLDYLGTRVGLRRRGWTNETYRAFLRAQVLVLRSQGRWPDLFTIMRALGVTLDLVEVAEPDMASIRVRLGDYLDEEITGRDVFDLLVRAKPGGVRLIVEYPASELDEAFMWADADETQADTVRGWADDSSTLGGYWMAAEASTESA